jgi:hypothetical protein
MLVVLCKLYELGVFNSFSSMKCQRQYFEGILSNWLIVLIHVDEYPLLICELLVLFEFIVELQRLYWTFITTCLKLLLDVQQIIHVVLLFPCCPNEVIFCKVFWWSLLPPVTLFQDAFNNRGVITSTYPKLFNVWHYLNSRAWWYVSRLCVFLNSIVKVWWYIICLKDCRVKLVVHSYF